MSELGRLPSTNSAYLIGYATILLSRFTSCGCSVLCMGPLQVWHITKQTLNTYHSRKFLNNYWIM